MKTHTKLAERYGKAKLVNRYNAETGEIIDRKVYDKNQRVIFTTKDYNEAHAQLINGDIER